MRVSVPDNFSFGAFAVDLALVSGVTDCGSVDFFDGRWMGKIVKESSMMEKDEITLLIFCFEWRRRIPSICLLLLRRTSLAYEF